ncbi:MAG: alpha/beta fold hydrolase [Lysinibacillus sp.]
MEQYLQMADGHIVFTNQMEPTGKCIGHIHILHGMAEHSARYDKFAKTLCAAGYFVTMHDHRGHGRTAMRNGQLGYFADEEGFDHVVQDVREVTKAMRAAYPDVPFILLGHSMGSFIARRFIQLYSESVDKVILCGTGAVTNLHIAGHYVAKALAKKEGKNTESPLLNELSFGSFNNHFSTAKTAFDWLCSVEEEVDKYIQDPYCGFIPTNQFFADLTGGLIALNKKSAIANIRKDLPIFFISGSEDPVGELGQGVYSVAQQFNKAGIEDITVYLLENKRHEILNEDNQQAVFKVILRWLEKYDT